MPSSPICSKASQAFHCLNDLVQGFSTLRSPARFVGTSAGLPRIECEVRYGDEFQKVLVFSLSNTSVTAKNQISNFQVIVKASLTGEIVEVGAEDFCHRGVTEGQFIPERTALQETFLCWLSGLVKDGYKLTEISPE